MWGNIQSAVTFFNRTGRNFSFQISSKLLQASIVLTKLLKINILYYGGLPFKPP